jgi:hypothetical protein
MGDVTITFRAEDGYTLPDAARHVGGPHVSPLMRR